MFRSRTDWSLLPVSDAPGFSVSAGYGGNFGSSSYGGGSDNYYGNYGGAGLGPTSYNPFGTGSPGQSVYVGAGQATPSASAVTNQFSGRVTNNTVLYATNKNGDHVIAAGTATQLLAQAQSIIDQAAYDNRYYNDASRAPNLRIPNLNGGFISFGTTQAFTNYLSRSTTWLVPESVVAQTFSATLGRAASSDDIFNMENLVNAGGSVSTVQWALAHTPEAATKIDGLFQSVLGRSLDPNSMADWQNRLGATSLADMKAYLAHTDEAAARINDVYVQTLNRGLDGGSLQGRQDQLGSSSLGDVRWSLAHTDEAAARINDVYVQTLNRGLDGGSLQGRQDQLGSSSLGDVRWSLAHTDEAVFRLNDVYVQTLNRGLDGGSLQGRQDQLGSSSLGDVRWSLAHTDEAVFRLNDVYVQTLNRGLDGGSLQGRQDQLGRSSLSDVRQSLAHSAEAASNVSGLYSQILERDPNAGDFAWAIDASLAQGASFQNVRFAVAHSAESVSNVSSLYNRIFERDPLSGDLAWAVNASLAQGASLQAVRSAVAHSPEATSIVSGLYQRLLGRNPYAEDLTWAQDSSLARGASTMDVRLAIAHSPEARVGFDSAYYLKQNPDVAAAGLDPYMHFITYGWKEGRAPDAFFDVNYYQQQNPDVAASGINPLLHYRLYGFREGRDPSIQFSTMSYLSTYSDVAAAGVNPLDHYINYGKSEGRQAFTATPNVNLINQSMAIDKLFNDVLGRAALSTEKGAIELSIDNGKTSIGDTRFNLAHTEEASINVKNIYLQELGYLPGEKAIASIQDGIGNDFSLDQVRAIIQQTKDFTLVDDAQLDTDPQIASNTYNVAVDQPYQVAGEDLTALPGVRFITPPTGVPVIDNTGLRLGEILKFT